MAIFFKSISSLAYASVAVALLAASSTTLATAFALNGVHPIARTSSGISPTTLTTTTALYHQPPGSTPADELNEFDSPSSLSSRRKFLLTTIAASATSSFVTSLPAYAADTKESLIKDLAESYTKIQTIPPLLEAAEWDKVRTVLKTPPVNELWNLGESKNTLVKLAKETGNYDIMELKDDLAISLQMTDQYSYDNVFIYFQPGNGKVKTKEPMEMAKKAIAQLKEALDVISAD